MDRKSCNLNFTEDDMILISGAFEFLVSAPIEGVSAKKSRETISSVASLKYRLERHPDIVSAEDLRLIYISLFNLQIQSNEASADDMPLSSSDKLVEKKINRLLVRITKALHDLGIEA